MDASHVGELHQPVGGQHPVGRGAAKQGETTAGHLKGGQSLVAEVDVLLSLHLHLGTRLVRALKVVEHQHVGIGGAAGLLEAAEGHAEQRIQALNHLAQDTRIDFDINVSCAGDGLFRDADRLFHSLGHAVGEGLIDPLAVGHYLHVVAQGCGIAHLVANGSDHRSEAAFGGGDLDGEVHHSHVARGDLHHLGWLLEDLEPFLFLQCQPDLLPGLQVVVDGNWHRDLVALREGKRQVDIHEKVLEDADGGCGRSQPTILGAGQSGQAPSGDGMGQVQVDPPPTAGVRDRLGIPVHRLWEELAQERGFWL